MACDKVLRSVNYDAWFRAKADVAKRGPGRPRKHPPVADQLHGATSSAAGKATGKVCLQSLFCMCVVFFNDIPDVLLICQSLSLSEAGCSCTAASLMLCRICQIRGADVRFHPHMMLATWVCTRCQRQKRFFASECPLSKSKQGLVVNL